MFDRAWTRTGGMCALRPPATHPRVAISVALGVVGLILDRRCVSRRTGSSRRPSRVGLSRRAPHLDELPINSPQAPTRHASGHPLETRSPRHAQAMCTRMRTPKRTEARSGCTCMQHRRERSMRTRRPVSMPSHVTADTAAPPAVWAPSSAARHPGLRQTLLRSSGTTVGDGIRSQRPIRSSPRGGRGCCELLFLGACLTWLEVACRACWSGVNARAG